MSATRDLKPMTNKTCLTCASWKLKASSMASSGFASCVNGKPYEYLPPSHKCTLWASAGTEQITARVEWFARIDGKRKAVTK